MTSLHSTMMQVDAMRDEVLSSGPLQMGQLSSSLSHLAKLVDDLFQLEIEDRVTVVYSLETSTDSNGDEIISLSYDIEFGGVDSDTLEAVDSLSDTLAFIEDYIGSAEADADQDNSNYDDILTDVLNTTTATELSELYDSFSNDETSSAVSVSFNISSIFNNSFFSCPESAGSS